jgi:hypothetical protein
VLKGVCVAGWVRVVCGSQNIVFGFMAAPGIEWSPHPYPRTRKPKSFNRFVVGFRGRVCQSATMSAIEVMNEIKALPPAEQERLVRLLTQETDWLEDVMDAAIARARMDEPERPVAMLLREQGLE